MTTLTAQQTDIIKHSLGLDHRRRAYRNGFAAEPGSNDHGTIEELVATGHMKRGRDIPGGLVYYHITQLGMASVGVKAEPN